MCWQRSHSRAGQSRCAVEPALASAKEVSERALTILNIFSTIPDTVRFIVPITVPIIVPFTVPFSNV